jgi:hypothetical protein
MCWGLAMGNGADCRCLHKKSKQHLHLAEHGDVAAGIVFVPVLGSYPSHVCAPFARASHSCSVGMSNYSLLIDDYSNSCWGGIRYWREHKKKRERDAAIERIKTTVDAYGVKMRNHGRLSCIEMEKAMQLHQRALQSNSYTASVLTEEALGHAAEGKSQLELMARVRKARTRLLGVLHQLESSELAVSTATILGDGAAAIRITTEELSMEAVNASLKDMSDADELAATVVESTVDAFKAAAAADPKFLQSVLGVDDDGSIIFPDVPTHTPVMEKEGTDENAHSNHDKVAVEAS